MRSKWEKVTEENGEKTDRLRVEGGWLYRTRTLYSGGSMPAMVFVPDLPMPTLTVDEDHALTGDGIPTRLS